MNEQLFKLLAELTVMNSTMITQLYELQHALTERVLLLAPNDPLVLQELSKIEQVGAALSAAKPLLEQMRRVFRA